MEIKIKHKKVTLLAKPLRWLDTPGDESKTAAESKLLFYAYSQLVLCGGNLKNSKVKEQKNTENVLALH